MQKRWSGIDKEAAKNNKNNLKDIRAAGCWDRLLEAGGQAVPSGVHDGDVQLLPIPKKDGDLPK